MNILVVCPHYTPDVAATGEVMTAIAEGLIDLGHELHIVTALPWYQDHQVHPDWRGKWSRTETTPWGRITRLHPFPTNKRNLWARALGFGGFTGLATLASVRGRRRPDVVLVMSPPLILGITGWIAARRWRVPLVFNIQDVFPDVAIEVGAVTNPVVIAIAKWLERFLYLRSQAVTVLSEDLRENLAAKIGSRRPERVEVIPNFVDTDAIKPQPRDNSYRREFGLGDRTVVMYAGNLGFSQSVDLLLDAARDLADDPSVVFVVNGGGSQREPLMARSEDLDNLVWVEMQPKERVGEVLAAADVHTVLLKTGLARSSVPSKLYSILASGRPAIASIDEGTEVARTLSEAHAGVSVPPDDSAAFVAAVRAVVADVDGRRRMGENGRRWVERWLSPSAVAQAYSELFERLVERH